MFFRDWSYLDSAMFGSLTSSKRKRVNTLRLIHSLALRACILNGFLEHDAVQLSRRKARQRPDQRVQEHVQ
jgi:hypothetical protein